MLNDRRFKPARLSTPPASSIYNDAKQELEAGSFLKSPPRTTNALIRTNSTTSSSPAGDRVLRKSTALSPLAKGGTPNTKVMSDFNHHAVLSGIPHRSLLGRERVLSAPQYNNKLDPSPRASRKQRPTRSSSLGTPNGIAPSKQFIYEFPLWNKKVSSASGPSGDSNHHGHHDHAGGRIHRLPSTDRHHSPSTSTSSRSRKEEDEGLRSPRRHGHLEHARRVEVQRRVVRHSDPGIVHSRVRRQISDSSTMGHDSEYPDSKHQQQHARLVKQHKSRHHRSDSRSSDRDSLDSQSDSERSSARNSADSTGRRDSKSRRSSKATASGPNVGEKGVRIQARVSNSSQSPRPSQPSSAPRRRNSSRLVHAASPSTQAAAAAAASRKASYRRHSQHSRDSRLHQSIGSDSGSYASLSASRGSMGRSPRRIQKRPSLIITKAAMASSGGSARSRRIGLERSMSIDSHYNSSTSPTGRALLDSSFAHPGRTQWRTGSLLGTGSFGSVYKGLNVDTGAIFAVKRIRTIESGSSAANSALASLEREISLLRVLEHVNIVKYLGTQRRDGHLHIFLEYVPGGSIASLLAEFGKFDENLVRVYTRQIAEGVTYLHDKQIIHRDIKGGNVLVTGNGCLKLADFGCSKQMEDLQNTAMENSLKSIRGSVPWMAPEVIKQSGHGPKADVWSIGATVVEMLTARHPWPSFETNVTALFHVASAGTGPPLPKGLSDLCVDALDQCFQIEPDDRCSARELLNHPFCADAPSFKSPHRRLGDSHASFASFRRRASSRGSKALADSDSDAYTSDDEANSAYQHSQEQSLPQ